MKTCNCTLDYDQCCGAKKQSTYVYTDTVDTVSYAGHKVFRELYEEIKHGDEEHQKWLKDKIEDFIKRKFE